MTKRFIALDQGTTSCRSILFNGKFEKLDISQSEFPQHFPKPGWVEHNAEEIWRCQLSTVQELASRNNLDPGQVAAIGITNQRETVLAWDRKTGKPLARAIVWQDRRTADTCANLKKRGLESLIRRKTGLIIDPYFSASKMQWLLKHSQAVRKAAAQDRLAFGTMDSWLIYKFTAGKSHLIEVGNAARTQLMNIRTCRWDMDLLDIFGIPLSSLPAIRDSDALFGELECAPLRGVPITGVAGDQQAALFGHRCFQAGSMKNTYGTGCFLLKNIGSRYMPPPKGLLGTVAWKIGGRVEYAHEGAVLVAGAVIQFLRDQWGVIKSAEETEALASSLASNDGVYFVPAFAGLGTPYWDAMARGMLIGLTRGTSKAHLCRAALESIAFQSRDLVQAFGADRSVALNVDGGGSRNGFLMQFQADILGGEVRTSEISETTAQGAAMIAALGCGLVKKTEDLAKIRRRGKVYKSRMKPAERERLLRQWKMAVERSRAWA